MDPVLASVISIIPPTVLCIGVELTKKMQIKLDEQTRKTIMKEGLYHLTSKEAALAIMESGYIKPSKGKLNNHYAKSFSSNEAGEFVYMFAGKPNLFSLAKNMAHAFGDKSDGAFYAIKHIPSKDEVDKYRQRVNDGAITYDGQLLLDKSKTEIVKMKLEKGKLIEIPMEEEIKVNPVKKKVIRCAGLAGLVVSSTQQLLCDTLRFSVMPKNRAKIKQYIQERKLVNKILKQKELEERSYEKKSPNKNSIVTCIKKWAKDKTTALCLNTAIKHIHNLERDKISENKEEREDIQ